MSLRLPSLILKKSLVRDGLIYIYRQEPLLSVYGRSGLKPSFYIDAIHREYYFTG